MSRPQPPATALLVAGYLIYALAGVLVLPPTRCCWCRPGAGSHLVPLAPVLAIGSNVGLPLLSRQLTGTVRSALPPVVGWLLAAFVLASSRPEGDVLLPAGDTAWVSYGVLFGGALAGLVTRRWPVGAGRRPDHRRHRSGRPNRLIELIRLIGRPSLIGGGRCLDPGMVRLDPVVVAVMLGEAEPPVEGQRGQRCSGRPVGSMPRALSDAPAVQPIHQPGGQPAPTVWLGATSTAVTPSQPS